MRRERLLAAVSTAQLATGVAGLVVALRRRHAYHFLFLRGGGDAVARDAVTIGTALSAPMPMLLAQATAIVGVLCRDSRRAGMVLAGLGAAMVPGYLGEELVRDRLRPSGFQPVETPLVAAAVGLAGAMIAVGWPQAGLRRSGPSVMRRRRPIARPGRCRPA